MTHTPRQSTGSACPACGHAEIVRHVPKEIGRQTRRQEVSNPDEPDKVRRITILHIQYRRDYFCPSCQHRWSETHVTEKQEET